jgi:hypothetical protein
MLRVSLGMSGYLQIQQRKTVTTVLVCDLNGRTAHEDWYAKSSVRLEF